MQTSGAARVKYHLFFRPETLKEQAVVGTKTVLIEMPEAECSLSLKAALCGTARATSHLRVRPTYPERCRRRAPKCPRWCALDSLPCHTMRYQPFPSPRGPPPTPLPCDLSPPLLRRSREVGAQGDDDFEGVVTKEMVQTGKSYEIFSADRTRLVRASNTKSSRCNKFLGYAWGGYVLTFEGPHPSPPSAAETQEPSPPSSAETQEDQDEDEGQQEQEVQEEHQHGQHEEQQEREEREGPSASSPSAAAAEKKTEEEYKEGEEERSSSFSFSGSPDAYRLHSDMHGGNTLFFLGKCYPAEWVVWDVGGKTDGSWEMLELRWQEGGKKFTISGHGGQHVRWKDADGVFRGTRSENKATEFVLKEKISSATGNDASSTNGSSSSSSSSSS
ncbi:unnamed protein product [Ectocarpus sp. CCAP 1310/34]|nr:unnamed protein product [Ectocarpus sp. CCAP 1310/34]